MKLAWRRGADSISEKQAYWIDRLVIQHRQDIAQNLPKELTLVVEPGNIHIAQKEKNEQL